MGGGTPSLTLSDENEPRIVLGVQKSVPRLFLFDRGGKGGVTLGTGDEDGSGMSLVDENGIRRAGLGMFDGRPSLFMSDANDKPRVGLGVSRSGPGLMLFDKTGNGRALLSVDDQDGGGLFFSDENQQAVWQAP